MIDLTINEKDKDHYITDIALGEDYKTYLVKYASGRIEEYPFSVHNYNVDIRKMEKQFYQYKDDYSEIVTEQALGVLKEKIQKIAIALISTAIVFQITDNHVIRIIAIILALLDMAYNHIKSKSLMMIYGTSLEYINQVERYLDKKNDFIIPITDPKNNEEEEWYLLNMSDVENTIFQPQIYEEIATHLSDDVKEELSKRISKELSRKENDNSAYTLHK